MDRVKHMKASNIQTSPKELVKKLTVEKNRRNRKLTNQSYYTFENKRYKNFFEGGGEEGNSPQKQIIKREWTYSNPYPRFS